MIIITLDTNRCKRVERQVHLPGFFSTDLYATTHFNSDPALLANVEQQLSSSLRDFAPAPGSFPGNRVLGNSLRTLLLPSGTPENKEIPTQRSLSGGFKQKDNVLANLNLKCGFQEATGSEAQVLTCLCVYKKHKGSRAECAALGVSGGSTNIAKSFRGFSKTCGQHYQAIAVILLPLGRVIPLFYLFSFLSQRNGFTLKALTWHMVGKHLS